MKDRAGNELSPGDRILYLSPGRSTSWLEWGEVDSLTLQRVRVKDKRGVLVLRDPRSVVKPYKE